MDDENNNMPNTQRADDQTPVSNTPDTNGGSDMGGDMPTPNNGEGEQPNVDDLPAGEEDENDNDEDMNDQRTGVNFDDHQ